MAIEDDVCVIGGGIAGSIAALAATQQTEDVQVRLITYKQSTLRNASGLVDVLGYTPEGEGPLANPFGALDDLPDGHPYERVGSEAVRDALAFFDDIVGDAYAGSHTDTNALVPTHGGTVKPTARYPTATAAGLASDPRDTLLVGFETLPDFDAPLAARHLEDAGVPFETRGVTIRFPGIVRDDATVTRYANVLDHDESVATSAGETGAREALAAVVDRHLDGESRVGFPAVLGDDHADAVRAELADVLGVDVFEVPMGPPSLLGLRLEDLLADALEDAGVRVTSGVPVIDYESTVIDANDTGGATDATGGTDRDEDAGGDDSENDTDENAGDTVGNVASSDDIGVERIDRVIVDRNGTEIPYRASQYVLATGGLVGKGVRSDRDRVFEPIFDCYVPHATDRYDWFVDDVFGEQPYARFGLAPDRDLRPLDAEGEPEFANLRAAGAVLGGSDYAAEKSGAGVSIATGYVAGTRAGTHAESTTETADTKLEETE